MRSTLDNRSLLSTLLVMSLAFLAGRTGNASQPDSLSVANRKTLAADTILCERVGLGEPDDYKPCIAQLPSGVLLLTAFHQHRLDGD